MFSSISQAKSRFNAASRSGNRNKGQWVAQMGFMFACTLCYLTRCWSLCCIWRNFVKSPARVPALVDEDLFDKSVNVVPCRLHLNHATGRGRKDSLWWGCWLPAMVKLFPLFYHILGLNWRVGGEGLVYS
ncbi:hypothetical protein DFH27DRAFT_580774 [Peziza echinospora]|nr:hypothetical protein DFH27DRAFT_580774 [Peziza echinospora]